jgi:hypothetical protein
MELGTCLYNPCVVCTSVLNLGMPNPKKTRTPCPICSKEPYRSFYKYCSNVCQREYEYRAYIADWKSGLRDGLVSTGIVSGPVKRYLREKFGNECCLCGWNKINQKTGVSPLVADHIDGNWRNNREENLRLLCPNCDALTPTFSALNKGNGRPNRAGSKRAFDAKMFRSSQRSSGSRASHS